MQVAVLKDLDRLEARLRRLQGRLSLTDRSGGPGRAAWDLRTPFSARARAALADLRARSEQAYAAVATGPDLGLSEPCRGLAVIARDVATWDDALSKHEATLRSRGRGWPPARRRAEAVGRG